MKKIVFAAVMLCLTAATITAQQPQPTSGAQAPVNADCNPPSAPKKPSWAERHIHIKVPDKLQREINQQTQSIGKKTGVELNPGPLSADQLTKQQAKPCTQPAAGSASSTSKQ